ncbi:MAG TPA: hypothetical protein VGH28_04380 [Polyangiaceae bacterium]
MRNAAKVALGSLFFGCGGAVAVDAPDAAKPLKDAATDVSDAAVAKDASVDAALACTGPTEVDASDVDESAFECCIATVQSDVGDATPFDDPNGPDASLVADNPSAANCCKVILARIDDEPDGGDAGGDRMAADSLFSWCCTALDEPMGPACTPWGPPTPPEMVLS